METTNGWTYVGKIIGTCATYFSWVHTDGWEARMSCPAPTKYVFRKFAILDETGEMLGWLPELP